MAIRRDIHPICDNCWDRVVGMERYKVKDLHHFFTYHKHAQCCWCGHPSHGQFWRAPRNDVPCQGLFGFHGDRQVIIDLDEIRKKYADDPEVKELISLTQTMQSELYSVYMDAERKAQ